MAQHDEGLTVTPPVPESERRQYIAPKLERLGTIGELTQGLGMDGAQDSEHPPGQNKSIV
ncbi:MAG: lasso RiPP family leader peptide-containing protein [Acidobacteriota bacterium]|nr:lasso RiPP family leader peptide-containing protein [Acidobacteriota bacterium]